MARNRVSRLAAGLSAGRSPDPELAAELAAELALALALELALEQATERRADPRRPPPAAGAGLSRRNFAARMAWRDAAEKGLPGTRHPR